LGDKGLESKADPGKSKLKAKGLVEHFSSKERPRVQSAVLKKKRKGEREVEERGEGRFLIIASGTQQYDWNLGSMVIVEQDTLMLRQALRDSLGLLPLWAQELLPLAYR
jgi:hypothetical protein